MSHDIYMAVTASAATTRGWFISALDGHMTVLGAPFLPLIGKVTISVVAAIIYCSAKAAFIGLKLWCQVLKGCWVLQDQPLQANFCHSSTNFSSNRRISARMIRAYSTARLESQHASLPLMPSKGNVLSAVSHMLIGCITVTAVAACTQVTEPVTLPQA